MEGVALTALETTMTTIRVADHTSSPGGRYISDGPFSGEWFREEVLRPTLEQARKSGERIIVELDGTSGYGASFLEEAFGGLVRTGAFPQRELQKLLLVEARTALFEPYKTLSNKFIQEARFNKPA